MTQEDYDIIINNQVQIGKKLDKITTEIRDIKSDLAIAISNQQLLEDYEIEITDRLKRIETRI